MKIKYLVVMVSIFLALIQYRPIYASGVVTTCDEAALETALTGGGVVDFAIGDWCEIIFTSEKVISTDTIIQNTSNDIVTFGGDYYTPTDTRLFTVNSGISLTLDNLILQNGKALFGGAVYVNEGNLIVRDSLFFSNTATETDPSNPGGGAIYGFRSTITIDSTRFDDNSSQTKGGAIENLGGDLSVTNAVFFSNSSRDGGSATAGGAIYSIGRTGIGDGSLIVSDSTFINNDADHAGAVHAFDHANGAKTIINNRFIDNYADTGGALLVGSASSVDFIISGNTFMENQATDGGGAILLQSGVEGFVDNNTFYNNNATNAGGALYVSLAAEVMARHNTFVGNTALEGGSLYISNEFVDARANIFQDGDCVVNVGGTLIDSGNNIAHNATGCVGANIDPQLNPIFSDAFVPSATSPALNAYASPCLVSDDQFGTSRPQGGMCDIGAIEGSASPNTTVTACTETALNLALAGAGVVNFNIGADCTIPFTFQKIIGTTTTIQNTSAFDVIFDGGDVTGLLTINNGATLTLDNLQLQNAISLQGGAIFNDASTLIVIDSLFDDNQSYIGFRNNNTRGGAIYSSAGAVTITNSVFTNNLSDLGGSVAVLGGDLSITGSIFTGNNATAGSAIYAQDGNLTIHQSEFSDNGNDLLPLGTVYYQSSGEVTVTESKFLNNTVIAYGNLMIWAVFSGSVEFSVQRNHFINNSTATNCSAMSIAEEPSYGFDVLTGDVSNNTFSGNSADSGGSTVCVWGDVTADFVHNTFADTVSGNHLLVFDNADVTLTANIFHGADCSTSDSGQLIDGGNNIAYNTTGCLGTNIDPQLGSLMGGTHYIPANSAIEYTPACEIAVDQLGVSRPQGGLCTPGAVEIDGVPVQVVTVQFASASGNASETANIDDVLLVTTSDSNPTDASATVTVSVTGGSATSADYVLLGTINIPAGTAHNAVIAIDSAITIVDDGIDEADETVMLTLSAPSGAVLGAQTTYTHTILDDDTAGYSVNVASVTDISEPNTTTTFSVVLNSQPNGTVVLDFGTTDATECVASPTTFTFTNLNWNGDQTITIIAQNDTLVDGAQPCEIIITRNASSTASEYVSVPNPANVAVMVNDDDVPVVERDLILTENELLAVLASQVGSDVRFVVVDISASSIVVVMSYNGEYGIVTIGVNNADVTRFVVASVTTVGGGAVSSRFNDYAYHELLGVMMSAMDTWIVEQVAPAVAEITGITASDIAITITVDVSN